MSGHLGLLSRSVAVAVFAMFGGLSAFAAGVPRIASMNVCTDQLLITLADPQQILGLSRFSRDAWQSFAADDARRYPILSGGAEDVLVLRPDVVVASQFDKRSTRELLREKGLHLVEFAVPRSLDEVKDQIRQMSEIVGHPDRAAGEIARLDAAVARARSAVALKRYRVLPLSRRGWVSGSDSLVSSLLTETGLFNAAADLGVGMGGYASLEAIVKLKPDFILVSEAGDRAEDDGRAFLLHPALERFYPPAKRIVIPERLTVCGGVMLAEALDVLVAELQRVER
jgi:iron complex transport system substrate-binding protein